MAISERQAKRLEKRLAEKRAAGCSEKIIEQIKQDVLRAWEVTHDSTPPVLETGKTSKE